MTPRTIARWPAPIVTPVKSCVVAEALSTVPTCVGVTVAAEAVAGQKAPATVRQRTSRDASRLVTEREESTREARDRPIQPLPPDATLAATAAVAPHHLGDRHS